jgi:circadian clock protein KaiB
MYKLKLYITGRTPRSKCLIKEIEKMFERDCGGQYTLNVFDVFEHPESAYEDAIIATPTLIKTLPSPIRRIVGDLTNEERVLAGLEIVKL